MNGRAYTHQKVRRRHAWTLPKRSARRRTRRLFRTLRRGCVHRLLRLRVLLAIARWQIVALKVGFARSAPVWRGAVFQTPKDKMCRHFVPFFVDMGSSADVSNCVLLSSSLSPSHSFSLSRSPIDAHVRFGSSELQCVCWLFRPKQDNHQRIVCHECNDNDNDVCGGSMHCGGMLRCNPDANNANTNTTIAGDCNVHGCCCSIKRKWQPNDVDVRCRLCSVGVFVAGVGADV